MKKNIFENKKGFTFIEVITVLAIMTTLMMATLAFLGQGRTEKELDSSATSVYAAIREAQNYALTGESIVNVNSECDRFRFGYEGASGVFSVSNVDQDGNQCSFMSGYQLENNVIFGGVGQIHFSVPSGKSDIETGVYVITLQKKNKYFSVCVYPMGAITRVSGASCPPSP